MTPIISNKTQILLENVYEKQSFSKTSFGSNGRFAEKTVYDKTYVLSTSIEPFMEIERIIIIINNDIQLKM
jgi:hypothetical protein